MFTIVNICSPISPVSVYPGRGLRCGAPGLGWTAYPPQRCYPFPRRRGRHVNHGVGDLRPRSILGAVDMVTTIVCPRCPGMTMFRMSIFTWNILVTSLVILLAFPVLTAALMALAFDRHLGGHIYDAATGGPTLWQHLFWFFGHPEVYIVALPFFGVVSEIIPVFSRKPLFGYLALVYATLAIGSLSMAVWAHHK
ncbi:cbb3-type cytochrome c oxidase subunit I [Nocardia sp. MDA0666]|uniref:cbb3-type cytochrome c oxidase subunit I n=1 Tax=Nocardia sp. MDA0666 TaxID=2135448 RepID=UPI003512DCC9